MNKKGFFDRLCNATVAITAVVGTIILTCEATQLRKQNLELQKQSILLEKTIKQSYRPLLYSAMISEHIDSLYVGKLKVDTLVFQFVFKASISNIGTGMLSYLGHITYTSDKKIDIRDNLLSSPLGINKIDNTNIFYDLENPVERGRPIKPEGNDTVDVICQGISQIEYYFYTIFFYEDQDGNLYDTQHTEYLVFKRQYRIGDPWIKRISNESYKSYTPQQKDMLKIALSMLKSGVADVISNPISSK